MDSVNYKIEDYYDGADKRPKGSFRISPSGIHAFFDKKVQWYSENLLGAPKAFTGSTATLNGTICHFVTEIVANCKIYGENYDSDKLHTAVESYIEKFRSNEDYDVDSVETTWKSMGEALVKEFVLSTNTLITEPYVQHELLPGIYVGGSIDAITSTAPTDTWEMVKEGTNVGTLTVRDFKTASTKPSSFPYGYSLQAYAYAYMLRQQGVNVDTVELCYVVKATKTLPIRTFRLTKPFDNKAYEFIEGILKLIADSVECFNNYSDLRYLLMGDYRQKLNDIPLPE